MGILADVFDEERRHLSEKIGDSPPEKAARIIRDFLGKLPAKYNDVQAVVTIDVNDLLSQLRQMIKATETTFEDEADESEPLPASPAQNRSPLLPIST